MNWIMNENAISMTDEIVSLSERLGFEDFISSEERIAGIINTHQALMNCDEEFITSLFESLKESAQEYDEEIIAEVLEAEDSAMNFIKTWKGVETC